MKLPIDVDGLVKEAETEIDEAASKNLKTVVKVAVTKVHTSATYLEMDKARLEMLLSALRDAKDEARVKEICHNYNGGIKIL